jgi:dipeptidyl aminopeptidase/acylaminoacyl peptidase
MAPDPIPTTAYYDVTRITEVAVSPDGDRVAFLTTDSDPEEERHRTSLFVAPADGSRPPHRLTRASDAGSPAWSPDGDRLAFTAAREDDLELAVERGAEAVDADGADGSGVDAGDGAGDEEGADDEGPIGEGPRSHVWVFDLELGGDARQVTTDESFPEGVSGFDWGPAGDRLVVAARDPTDEQREYLRSRREEDGPVVTERLQHKGDGAGWLDQVRTYLFVVDVPTREPRRLDDAYGGGALEFVTGVDPTWGTDRIAFLSNRTEDPDDSGAMDVYTVRPDGTGLERHTDAGVMASALAWDDAGDRLAFTGADPEDWTRPTEAYLLEDGEVRSLSGSLDRTVAHFGGPVWTDGGALVGLFADEARHRPVRLSGEIPEYLADLGPYHTVARVDAAGGTTALLVSHPSEGTDVRTVATGDLLAAPPGESSSLREATTRISGTNAGLIDEHPMPEPRRVTFESDGRELDAVAYLPEDFAADEGPRPLVVSIHGGPVSYDLPEFRFEYAMWASRGYVVVCPNYRGGASYGHEFARELRGEWGTVEVDDVVACAESVCERGWTDPDRVFGRGISYGGIAQGHLVTQTDLFAAAAPEHGIYDLRADFGTSDSHTFVESEFGLPWEDPEAFEAGSSITDVDEVETPLLVMAGSEDWRCPPSQSEQLYLGVRKQGVPARLVVYDDHHDVSAPDRAVHRFDQLVDWYARHDPGRGDESENGSGDGDGRAAD